MTQATDATPWYLYILRCADNSLYTGISPDVARRLAVHRSGKGSRYLRGRSPLTLIASHEIGDRSVATRAEMAFKRLTKRRKESLLVDDAELRRFLDTVAIP
ncbi:MAG: GIY-YIG nuclease family protein [Pseudomonadota bacterium]